MLRLKWVRRSIRQLAPVAKPQVDFGLTSTEQPRSLPPKLSTLTVFIFLSAGPFFGIGEGIVGGPLYNRVSRFTPHHPT